MKKLVALLVCLVLVFSLFACGNSEPAQEDEQTPDVTDKADTDTEKDADAKESGEEGAELKEDEPAVGMPNPMTECKSLDDVNKAVGGNLCGPAAMGVSDEAFFVIDCGSYKIGEYRFEMNGYEYTFRCAKVKDDISGVYLSGQEGSAFSAAVNTVEGEELVEGVVLYAAEEPSADSASIVNESSGMQLNSDNTYKCARWFDGDMQYVLTVNDGGAIENDTFISIANEFMLKTQGNM